MPDAVFKVKLAVRNSPVSFVSQVTLVSVYPASNDVESGFAHAASLLNVPLVYNVKANVAFVSSFWLLSFRH